MSGSLRLHTLTPASGSTAESNAGEATSRDLTPPPLLAEETPPSESGSLPRSRRVEHEAINEGSFSGFVRRLHREHGSMVAGVMIGATALPGLVGVASAQPAAQANPFTLAATPEAKLQLLKVKAIELEGRQATMTPEALIAAREALYQQYLAGGGTLGINTDEDQDGKDLAREILFRSSDKQISTQNVTSFDLFKYFWESNEMGLARRGLDEVTPEGVDKLYARALAHELDGTPSPEGARVIDADERAVMKAILEHDHYGAFVELDARPPLLAKFGLDAGSVHMPAAAVRPQSAGHVAIPTGTSKHSVNALRNADIASLPEMMKKEYGERKAYFEGSGLSQEERGLRVVGLLADYSAALSWHGNDDQREAVGNALLDVFDTLPYSKVVGSKDFNAAGWSVAQSLVLGLDANKYETKFPDALPTGETTYLSMDGAMAPSMKFVDDVREAMGLPRMAESFELKSVLNWVIGEESGHKKHGALDEKKPFATSGLNWGALIFPNDTEVKDLPPSKDVEFAIDCIDAYGNVVPARAAWGDRIVVKDEAGNPLTATKVINKDGNGKATSWSIKFTNAQGQEVDQSKVLGVIVNSNGKVKGDGKATRSLDMWWWGFCDRNTAQRLYKSKYKIPQLDRESITVHMGGKAFSVPKAEAQKLIDMDIPDLVPYSTMVGFRFNDEPQAIKLKDGTVIEGKVTDLALEAGPGVTRLGGDMIAIHDAPSRPMLGNLQIEKDGSKSTVDVRDLGTLTMDPATGQVTANMRDGYTGYQKEVTGKLLTDVKWDQAQTVGGKQVLTQSGDYSIRGAITVEIGGDTQRINLSDVSQITGETKKDMRMSELMVWVSENGGLFATDGSTGVVVSNGMRWVNKIDLAESQTDERPGWAKDKELVGIDGPLVRQAGDKILWARALYSYDGKSEANSEAFSGWVQVSKSGRILNEGFISGQPDFGWSGYGPLNWNARSSFNKHMIPEFRLRVFVNGVSDQAKLQGLADAGNLPSNWKTFLEPQS
ncbi:MAG: hypothetical protein IT384_23765 [Deltaproteobacteria bacterium]|nr:hypothetical protein [Deltaproteobacteria bacterium]